MLDKKVTCEITGKKYNLSDTKPLAIVRSGILALIKKDHPSISIEGHVSKDALAKYRQKYIESMLEVEKGELSNLDKNVIKSMVKYGTLSKNINAQYSKTKKNSFGERLSDKIASFGGSWKFIIIFGIILFSWIIINTIFLFSKPFDPYPFILMNLILSCIAALQAPIIMMSQNRKEEKDRLRAENDYEVNLKAELEIRILHEKIDNLVQHQWQRLLEIQQMQVDMMDEKAKRKK